MEKHMVSNDTPSLALWIAIAVQFWALCLSGKI